MCQNLAISILLGCWLTASGAGVCKEPKKAGVPQSELTSAPLAARSWRNPYAGQPQAIQAGRQIYARHCAQCHGTDGKGRGKAPDLHSPSVEKVAPGTLFRLLRNGNLKEGMPSWSSLPDQQLWQLVSFLQASHDNPPPRQQD